MIRASVPKMNLDATFEQKDEIAKAVEEELEKVCVLPSSFSCFLNNGRYLLTICIYAGNVNVWI